MPVLCATRSLQIEVSTPTADAGCSDGQVRRFWRDAVVRTMRELRRAPERTWMPGSRMFDGQGLVAAFTTIGAAALANETNR